MDMTNRIRVMTPGAYRVEFSHTEKKGGRNMKASGVILAANTDAEGARRVATEKRGHLPMFKIVSVEQDYETRPMTRDEEFAAASAALAAIQAKRVTK